MPQAKATTDYETIRRWAEARGGHPAIVKGAGNGEPPILRIDFPGYSGEDTPEEIGWNQFFDYFDQAKLALLYQDEPNSRFFKLVRRETLSAKNVRPRRRRTRRVSSRRGATQTRARKRTAGRGSKNKRRKTAAPSRVRRGRKAAGGGRAARGQGGGGRKKRQAR